MADETTEGTALETPAAESTQTTAPVEESTTQAGEGDGQQQDAFLDDATLLEQVRGDEKLNHFFTKMQGSYTKKMQQIAETRNAAETVRRFDTDAEFATQVIRNRASQLGLQIGTPGQAQPSGTPTTGSAPTDLVEAIKAKLPAELQWMAQTQADAVYAGNQHLLKPLQEKQALDEKAQRTEQYEVLASQLTETRPGWEEHEEDMNDMLAFLQSPKLSDRKHGSKLGLLHRLVTGGAAATAEAARRLADGAKTGVKSGQVTKPSMSTVSDQIRKAKNDRDAWAIARKVAEEEGRKMGLEI